MIEIAGLFSEFPEKLERKVTQELSKAYETEKRALLADLAKEKETWEEQHTQEIKDQIKARLMQMAQSQS